MQTSTVIQAKGLSKKYSVKGSSTLAVTDVNFEIAQGEFVALLGPSGCGKSTILNCIAGLSNPTTGFVKVEGRRVTSPLGSLGVAFQEPLLMDWRTAIGNVMMQIEMRGKVSKTHRDRARHLLEAVGLEGFENAYPWQLSGGMKQRVALCRAMIHDPAILLLDEPFGALDTFTRDQLNLDLSRLTRQEGKTVVLVTHSITEAVFLSDRIMVMTPRPGRIIDDIQIDLEGRESLDVRTSEKFFSYERKLFTIFQKAGILRNTLDQETRFG